MQRVNSECLKYCFVVVIIVTFIIYINVACECCVSFNANLSNIYHVTVQKSKIGDFIYVEHHYIVHVSLSCFRYTERTIALITRFNIYCVQVVCELTRCAGVDLIVVACCYILNCALLINELCLVCNIMCSGYILCFVLIWYLDLDLLHVAVLF
jgi:hypothetical protein